MTMPHVDLGNSLQDIGQGANTFAAGLLAQRARQQQIAIQEALAASKTAVDQSEIGKNTAEINQTIPAQAGQMNANTKHLTGEANTIDIGNAPADDTDEVRLREVDPSAPKGVYQGYTKAQAQEHTKVIADYMARKLSMQATQNRFEDRGALTTDVNGNTGVVHPNQPNGGGFQPIAANPGSPGAPNSAGVPIGKPISSADRKSAGSAQAARSAKIDMQNIMVNHPEIAQEVAKALTLPNIGRLSFIPGTGEGIQQVLDSFRFAGASPQAQVFLKRMFDFAGIVGPARYGVRGMNTPRTMQQVWSDFGLGQFGLTPEGIQAAMRNQDNAERQLEEMAGPNALQQSQGIFPQTQSTIGEKNIDRYGIIKR